MRRLFFALWPDREGAGRLAADCTRYLGCLDAQAVAAPELHVTLCFLGLLDEAAEALIVQRASGVGTAGFELQLDTLEHWSASQALVLAASSVPAAALELVGGLRSLARDCGCAPEQADWRAHITLARHVAPAAQPRPGGAVVTDHGPALRLAAQHFFLVQSQPTAPRYRRLHEWPLRSRPD